jgi:phytoene synthase
VSVDGQAFAARAPGFRLREGGVMAEEMALLDDLLEPERLAFHYVDGRSRKRWLTILALDRRMATILRSRREPIMAQVRLAWWRETLARDPSHWPQGEPLLEALREWRDPSGLAELASGWEALLSDELSPGVIAEFIAGRGAAFTCLARELGVDATEHARAAAEIWALADLAAHVSDSAERAGVVGYRTDLSVPRLPRSLRPLAILAGLGAAALRKSGAPLLSGRASALLVLRIGLVGR